MLYIILEGGLIQNICTDNDENTEDVIRVVDYDLEGLGKDDISVREDGQECYTYIWDTQHIETIKPMKFDFEKEQN